MSSATFTVLFVCTANLCRSPLAEYLARDRLGKLPGATEWIIESAGTHADDGLPMHPHAQDALADLGHAARGFRSHRLSQERIGRADLILTAERAHRAAVVTAVPAAVRRTFTIRQFARMAAQVGPISPDDQSPAGRLLDEARANRSRLQPVDAVDDDLADPIGRGRQSFRQCAEQLTRLVSTMTAPLSATAPA